MRRCLSAALLLMLLSGTAYAQRTDVVRLANGDRLTGEISSLTKNQLQIKTDDAGTVSLEWDKVVSLESSREFDVTTLDGRRFLGSLSAGALHSLIIKGAAGEVSLPTLEVTEITPIGTSFWRKLDGSLDIGFSYTRSSEVAQLSINTTTLYRNPAFEARLYGSATLTYNGDDGSRDDRGTIQASYLRFRGQQLFIGAGVGFESNESLGLRLRSQVASVAGARLINTNRSQLALSAGLSVNDERNVDADPTQNLEGLFTFRSSYYTYDRPRTNIDISLQYYPGLTDWGRQRIQLDAGAKREIWRDVFLSINLFDTFDSRPPTTSANANDVGIVLSFGWSY
jgi:opacity protein-like surface antigen